MICPNCGAEFSDDTLACPYCGCENETAAKAHQKAEISGIYAKIAALLQRPEQTVRRASRLLLRIGLILIGIFLIALLAAFLYARISPEMAYQKQREQLEQLEALYQEGDYTKMYQTLEKAEDSRNAVYDKFRIIGELDQTLTELEESCPETAAFVRQYPKGADLLDSELDGVFTLLNDCAALEEAGYVYGEGEAAADLRERAYDLLSRVLCLTEEEIQEGMALAAQEEADYSKLRNASVARLSGGTQ